MRVKVTIAPDGSVAAAVPLSGPQSLREAAVRAVLGWQFAAQATQAEIEVPFSLSSAHRSIVPPAPVRRVAPQAAGKPRGSVRVVAMVSSDGQVEFASSVAGPGELMPAAVAAVRQWTFRPMLRDGQPSQGTAVVDVVAAMAARELALPHFDFVQPVGALQHFARLAAVRRADDAVALHHIENARGAAVAQAQVPLQRGGGSLAHLQHQRARPPRTCGSWSSLDVSARPASSSSSGGAIRKRLVVFRLWPAPSRNPPRR